MSTPQQFLQFIDDNADRFISRLGEAVAIPSVSGDPEHRCDVSHMASWLNGKLQGFGVETNQTEKQDKTDSDCSPIILGRIGKDPKKKTVLVYGHYDVQPAKQDDGWNSDPFILQIEDDGRLVGRGSTDDKGPILGWLNVLDAHQALGLELPVNMRFCFEGMEESGSTGLDEVIKSEAEKGDAGWFDGVDCVCISDNYWLTNRKPCLTYGLRGVVYFQMTVSGPTHDLHSGMFGRVVYEPMTDLIHLMSKLVTPDGTILVPGVDNLVEPLTEEERKIYESIDYTAQDVTEAAGAPIALSNDKMELLMGRMCKPSLSLHGIQGAFCDKGTKTIIPASVTGKFSLRIVEPQTPEIIKLLVVGYMEQEFAKLNSKNTFKIETVADGLPWKTDPDHWNYEAARLATQEVYQNFPDLCREGGSIPVTLTFADSLGKNVLLLPMGRGDDGAHSTNEKIDRSNFIGGSKLLGTYLYHVAAAREDSF